MDERAIAVCKRYNTLKNAASTEFDKAQDIAYYFMPRYGDIMVDTQEDLSYIEDNLYDDVGRNAANDASAGFLGQMAPVGQKWMRVEADWPDPSQAAKDWFASASITLEELMATSDFYNNLHEDILINLGFGTSDIVVEQGKEKPFKFSTVPFGKFVFENNDENMPDTVYQEFKWTAKQMADRFGKENLADEMQEILNGNSESNVTSTFKVIQKIAPREGGGEAYPAAPDKRPYEELYVDATNKKVMSEGGFYENPHIIGRFKVRGNSYWGYGIGHQTLPKARQINDMEQSRMLILERLAEPGWIMYDEGSYTPDNSPNGVTYYRDPQAKPEQLRLTNDADRLLQDLEMKRDELKRSWFSDIFRMLQDMPNEKTATEIFALQEEKFVLFSSALTLYQKEKLDRILERCFAIAYRMGWFGNAPFEVIERGSFKITYTSRIALSVKAQENVAISNFTRLVLEAGQVDPSVLAIAKIPQMLTRVAENMGLDPELYASSAEIEAAVAEARQAQSLQQGVQTAEVATKAIGNLK